MAHSGHIHFGVIQRTKKKSALGCLAYQSCAKFRDDLGNYADYRSEVPWHIGTAILLPPGADPEFAHPENFLLAAIFRETRRDAQEGRTLDLSMPRCVPAGLEVAIGAWALAPLAEIGMAMQIDVERPTASDDGPNPHIHVFLSQRQLDRDGFGIKRREWNEVFRRDRGRYLRALIASRVTAACALLGLPGVVDPRPNAVRKHRNYGPYS
jgi:hypothetical protein